MGLTLFLEPLRRGIDEHTSLNYEILDCEDLMCIKYIAVTGRNQDAVLVSPAYIPHIFLNLISVYTAQYTECGLISITCFEAIKIVNIQMALFTELR